MIPWILGLAAVAQAGVVRVATGPVLADGTTVAEVRLWTDTPAEKLKIVPASGTLGAVAVAPDGLVTVKWTPAAATAEGTVAFTVTAGKTTSTLDVPVVPPVAPKVAVTVDPPLVDPGGVASVKITGGSGDLPVLVKVSAGTLGPLTREPDGWRASWTAPKATAPLIGVFTVADGAHPDRAYTTAVARVRAKQTVKVEVPAGSRSTLVAGETRVGPVPASGTSASFDLVVDPAARTGTLEITRADGSNESRGVILATGAATLAWLPGPTSWAGQEVAVLRLAAVGADGGMLTANAPRVTATAGTVRDLKVEGNFWRVDLALPPGGGKVVVSADLAGSKADVEVQSNPLSAAKLTTGSLPATGGDVEVRGPAGSAIELREAKGTPKVVAGETVLRAIPTGDRVIAAAHPIVTPSSLSARRIAVWSDTAVLAANGADSARLTAVVLDAAGAPVKDAEVAIRLVGGDGSVPSLVRTDAHGIAELEYVAGRTAGPIGIRLETGRVWTEYPLFQAAGPSGPALAPAPDATAAAWQRATPQAVVWREGKAPPPHPLVGAAVAAPVPEPAPEPVAAGPDAPARVPKPSKPAKSSSEAGGPWASVALTDSHGGYSQEGPGTGGLVPSAVVPTPPIGFLGLEGQVDWPVVTGGFGAVAAIGRVHLRGEAHEAAGDQVISPQYDLQAGLRWHAASGGPVAPDATLALHSLSAVAFEASGEEVDVVAVGRVGARPAVGATIDLAALTVRGEAGLTLGPGPIAGGVEIAAAFGTGAVRPRASIAFDHRGFEVEDARIRQTRGVLSVGLQWDGG